VAQEVAGNASSGLLMQFDKGELRGPVDTLEPIELALLGADLGDVDVKVADQIGLELAPVGLVALDTCGRREMSRRCGQRCSEERVRCGRVGFRAYRQSCSGSSDSAGRRR